MSKTLNPDVLLQKNKELLLLNSELKKRNLKLQKQIVKLKADVIEAKNEAAANKKAPAPLDPRIHEQLKKAIGFEDLKK